MRYLHFLLGVFLTLLTVNALAVQEQRVGRYTIVKIAPTASEVEPLSAIKALRFPEHIQDVYSAIVHLMQQTGYTLKLNEDTRQLLTDLKLPQAHRELSPLSIIDALHILLGDVWEIRVDHKFREISVTDEMRTVATAHQNLSRAVTAKAHIGSMQEPVIAHHQQIHLKSLIQHLVPRGWEVSYQLPYNKITKTITFHAETSRKRALEQLFLRLKLSGIFYPGQGLLLVKAAE